MADPNPDQDVLLKEEEVVPPPGQALAIVNTNPISTSMYTQWYADVAHDPFCNNYSVILQTFSPKNDMALLMLLDLILGNNNIPQAFLALTHGVDDYKILMLHRPSHFVPLITGRAMMWDNIIFTYKGDIMSGKKVMSPICLIGFWL